MRYTFFSIILATVFMMTGCQGFMDNGNNEEGQGTMDNVRNTRDGYNNNGFTENVADRNRNSNNRNSNNTQDRYEVSDEAAERIVDEIVEIDRAYVLTTENNAYVAATLDRENMTPNDNLSYNDRQNSSAGMNVRNTKDRNVKNRTVNEGNANERRQDNHMANRKDTATDDVANKRDVESDEVTDEVKNQIADIVQEVDKDIDNVYVSTSPDFFDLTDNYVSDLNDGRPVQGFFDQIGNTIERIFPQNKR